jgi:hypothetical protein
MAKPLEGPVMSSTMVLRMAQTVSYIPIRFLVAYNSRYERESFGLRRLAAAFPD